MLAPNFEPAGNAAQIGYGQIRFALRAPRCAMNRATIVLRKIDAIGRPWAD
jgi:hypothetical protein